MLVKINFMAIKNLQTGEYYKINKNSLSLNYEGLIIEEYKDKQHRIEGDSKWLIHKESSIFIPNLITQYEEVDFTLETEKNIKNILTKVAYLELKKLPEYTGYEDC